MKHQLGTWTRSQISGSIRSYSWSGALIMLTQHQEALVFQPKNLNTHIVDHIYQHTEDPRLSIPGLDDFSRILLVNTATKDYRFNQKDKGGVAEKQYKCFAITTLSESIGVGYSMLADSTKNCYPLPSVGRWDITLIQYCLLHCLYLFPV